MKKGILIVFTLMFIFIEKMRAQQPQITFPFQGLDFMAAPRTNLDQMSIKLWDNYHNPGAPTMYGTVLEIYGRHAHQTSQLYFGGWDNSKIRYREAFWADQNWNEWITLLDSKNNIESGGLLMVGGSGNHFIKEGNLGIGTMVPKERLSVNGKIRAHEVKVEVNGWPDYVFRPGYTFPSLRELEKQIEALGHLPGVPSAKEVDENGLSLGSMDKILLQKIEELTLYLIEKDKAISKLEESNARLAEKIELLILQNAKR